MLFHGDCWAHPYPPSLSSGLQENGSGGLSLVLHDQFWAEVWALTPRLSLTLDNLCAVGSPSVGCYFCPQGVALLSVLSMDPWCFYINMKCLIQPLFLSLPLM